MNVQISSFIWQHCRRYKWELSVFLIVAIIWAAELSISPYLLKLIIDGVNAAGDNQAMLLPHILLPVILYGSISFIININFRVYDYAFLRLFPQLKKEIVESMYAYLSAHSYRYFLENFSGSLANKISDMADAVEKIVQTISEMFVPRMLSVVFASLMLALVNPIISLTLLGWVMVFIIVTYFISKKSERLATAFSESRSQLSGKLVDSVSNIITAKLFSNISYERKIITTALEVVAEKNRRMLWYMLIVRIFLGLWVSVLVISMLMLLIHGRQSGWVTIGDFAFVLSVSMFIMWNMWDVGHEMVRFSKEVGKCRQALSIVVQPHEIKDCPQATRLTITEGEINFNNVNFSYIEGKPIFKDLTLSIPPGQKVGLVGFSGGGKTTFVNLILRLFEVQSGQIKIDGQYIKSVTSDSLRNHIAMIPQDPFMFHRSIKDNIAYGYHQATDEEIIEAAKLAHCHEFIQSLQDGYDSLVGERGVKLSGGQRQRIAIARAILKNAKIILLDEATSSLDSITERYIQDSLHQMMKGKTAIVIAHRLSTLLDMDRILVFNNGEIVEDGSIDELRARQGDFSKLWEMQSGGYLPDLSGLS